MGIGYYLCPATMQGGEILGARNLIGLFLVKAGGALIDNCVTRLRLEVKVITAVNDKVIKSAGVAGVIKPGKTSVQVIIGTKVQFVADAFSRLCE